MAMAKGRYFYREMVPFTVMVIVECSNVGLTTLFKQASMEGVSYQVFIFYSFAISGVVLAPLAFFVHRNTPLPQFNLSLFGRIAILAIIGLIVQLCGYKGVEYSSPTLASSISNLTPVFTFVLALIFRMEKLELRSLSTQAKIIGSILSISGALIVILYEGPTVVKITSQPSILLTLKSSQSNWIIGGLLFTSQFFLLSAWYIVQVQILRKYPAELVIVSFYNLLVAIIAAPIFLYMVPNLSAWKISTKVMLVAILYSGLYGYSFIAAAVIWVLRVKGPVFVALFTPMSIAIAAIMSVIFLGDSLYLGSVIGAVIISVGFYIVMWGNAKEDMTKDYGVSSLESPSPENVSLLQ